MRRCKIKKIIFRIFFSGLFLTGIACESVPIVSIAPSEEKVNASIYARYAPVKMDIMPLTEFVEPNGVEGRTKIKAYVSLSDMFGCQMKSPCVFRFELYEHIKRSGEPKGKRLIIWPDINLNNVTENNKYWRDFLRAYEFNFDFEPQKNQSYILQATCLCPNGRRLSADFNIRYAE
jgi:hypothetical protein